MLMMNVIYIVVLRILWLLKLLFKICVLHFFSWSLLIWICLIVYISLSLH